MLTLPQIVQRTAGRRKESAKYVKIIHVKKGWDSLGRGFVASASYSTKIWDPHKQRFVKNTTGPGGKPRRYVTVIVFLDPRLHVISSCSCADFKYRWEVALNHKQAAEIEYSNGELPVIRNPSMRAAQCKHLIALYEKIKPELPKPKKNDQTAPINPPQVMVPPSQQKKVEPPPPIKPIVIKAPKNVQRSVKPGKKQSTLPRSMQQPKEAPKPKPVVTPPPPPAMMKPSRSKSTAPKKSAPAKSPPAMMKPKSAKPASKPATKPAVKPKAPPAMMRAPAKAPVTKAPPAMMRAPAKAPAKSPPAMMRSKK